MPQILTKPCNPKHDLVGRNVTPIREILKDTDSTRSGPDGFYLAYGAHVSHVRALREIARRRCTRAQAWCGLLRSSLLAYISRSRAHTSWVSKPIAGFNGRYSSSTQPAQPPSPNHTAGIFPRRKSGHVLIRVAAAAPSARSESLVSRISDGHRRPLDDIMDFLPLRVAFGEFCRKALCSEVCRRSRSR